MASSGGEDDKALALLAEDWGLKSTHCLARAEDGGEKKSFKFWQKSRIDAKMGFLLLSQLSF